MSTNQNGSGGADPASGGEQEQNPNNSPDPKKDTVSFESHQKLLKEKKALADKIAAFESDQKKREQEDLEKNQQFQKLAETYKKEADDWKGKFEGLSTNVLESRKIHVLQSKLSGKLPSEYWGLIELDQIAHDPETGKVDELSVARYAKEFEKKHSRLIDKPNAAKLPNDAAKGGTTTLTYDEWLKLPLTEQQKRMKDVDKSTL